MARNTGTNDLTVIDLAYRFEDTRSVTTIAGVAGRYMSSIFSSGRDSVVAGRTGTDHLSVIHLAGRLEGRSHMATFTLSAGRNMREILARCIRTIVTTVAVAGNALMAELGRLPRQ